MVCPSPRLEFPLRYIAVREKELQNEPECWKKSRMLSLAPSGEATAQRTQDSTSVVAIVWYNPYALSRAGSAGFSRLHSGNVIGKGS